MKLKTFLQKYPLKFMCTKRRSEFAVKFIPGDDKWHECYGLHMLSSASQAKQCSENISRPCSVVSDFQSDAELEDEDSTDEGWVKVRHRTHEKNKSKQIDENDLFPPLPNSRINISQKPSFQKSYAFVTSGSKETVKESRKRKQPELQSSKSINTQQRKGHSILKGGTTTDIKDLFTYINNFNSGHHILFTSTQDMSENIEALALVPWLSVYDFDKHSREDGLLSRIEDSIKQRRSIHVCTWRDRPHLSHHGTQWCLLRGSVQEADSRTPDDDIQWMFCIRENYEKQIVELANISDNYCTLTFIVLWPSDLESCQYMFKALSKIAELIENPNIVICSNESDMSSESKTMLGLLKPKLTLIKDFKEILQEMSSLLGEKYSIQNVDYKLPTFDKIDEPHIDESMAAIFREDFEILYLDNPYRKTKESEMTMEELHEEEKHFYRGGNLHWFALYLAGAGHFDAERDLTTNIVRRIKHFFLEPFKSGKITIYHAPGAGGSTLGQRVLWELRSMTPCGQVQMNSRTSVQDIVDRIKILFEKTNLPVVLLVDGEDQQRFTYLHKFLERAHLIVILLHIKRCTKPRKTVSLKETEFWLAGTVSSNEANKIGIKFSNQCDSPEKKDQIDNLVKDVADGKDHLMYEFGMVAFLSEFKGVRSFVRGYLQLDKNPTEKLLPWQKIIGYLSLVYYYGQTSMPCQFFSTLLGLPPNYDVTMEDFPFPVQMFIVSCSNENKRNTIRICHYTVAKEILEYMLTWNKNKMGKCDSSGLSITARYELYEFLTMFLEDIKAKKIKSIVKSGVIADILRRTLIFRDNQDVGDNEVPGKRKLSRLMADIECKAPYMERIDILKRLTDIFPEDANFHAHLGRMYSICRPEDEKRAENCFIQAVDLCRKKKAGKSYENLDDSAKHTLKHVYHMFGMFYLQRITKYTGKSHGDKPEILTPPDNFDRKIRELLQDAKDACYYFFETRELTNLIGYEEAYGYVGEIATRLKICEFIYRHMTFKEFEEFLEVSPDSEIVNFVKDSITTILELFLQCYGCVDSEDLPPGFFRNIYWYNALFKSQAKELERLDITEDIYSRRLHVAVIKLKYGKDESLGTLERISSKSDIEEIVRICEQNFKDADRGGFTPIRSAIDLEYKDWLNAIRHEKFPEIYCTADVLRRVRHWYDTLKSPSSKFYLFILLSLLGFGYSEETSSNDEMLREANELLEQLRKGTKALAKPRSPKEWYGKGPGIKCLIPSWKVRKSGENRVNAGDSSTTHLAVFKGTITRPHTQRQTGYIKMDLGDNKFTVRVFFIPVRTKEPLVGSRYAGERVEFVLAFTYADGYEAYNVALLKKYHCFNCNRKVEITSDKFSVHCKCGRVVTKSNN
ncbi:uncharacterized protein LOC134273231 [Saccostrea cucullata]|uniref:uncharacterized protein LOC134273231 n=1 Tax=Saccostrea cuccullata TaxID=36930 RepID=UPI002ED1D030